MQQSFSSFGIGLVLAVVLVYLILMAQFASFSDPFIILLAVPPGLSGALVFLFVTGSTLNVMSLMGLVMTAGIAVSNSILIVEFTGTLRKEGRDLKTALVESCKARLRPILMTSLATILGLIPMALALGTGQRAIRSPCPSHTGRPDDLGHCHDLPCTGGVSAHPSQGRAADSGGGGLMSSFAIKYPFFILMMCLFVVVVGVTTVSNMPVDLFPEVNIPVVVVATFYAGMPPQQIESDITNSYERFFTLGSGIDHIESRSLPGVSLIKIYFQPGTDSNAAVSNISNLAMANLRRLPPGTLPPVVLKFDAANLPVCLITLKGEGLNETQLKDLAQFTVRNQVANVPGASVPQPYGGRYRQIMVYVDPVKLEAHQMSVMDVVDSLNTSNLILPAGDVRIGMKDYNIYANSQIPSRRPDQRSSFEDRWKCFRERLLILAKQKTGGNSRPTSSASTASTPSTSLYSSRAATPTRSQSSTASKRPFRTSSTFPRCSKRMWCLINLSSSRSQ